jgi:hypothetical protein
MVWGLKIISHALNSIDEINIENIPDALDIEEIRQYSI